MLSTFVYAWLAFAAHGEVIRLSHLAVFCERHLIMSEPTHDDIDFDASESRMFMDYVRVGARQIWLAEQGYFDPVSIGRLRYLRGCLERSARPDIQRALALYIPYETPRPPPFRWRGLLMKAFGLPE